MARVQVKLESCIQDSQDFGSDDEHMVSRVFVTITVGDKKTPGYVDIKQTVGASPDTIEVGRPQGYRGPFNQDIFRREVSRYFLARIGPAGSGIRIEDGATDIRMRRNVFVAELIFEFDADETSKAW